MYFYDYNYDDQQGEKYNEIYTYDKTWNESSSANRQKVTGVNLENFWIDKYGQDFCPYRSVGYSDIGFRKPNQKRVGGISIGQPGSSPLEYTNGSHPRYIHFGNRLVGVCGHCMSSVGLPTGKAVFFKSDGTAITYDIENWQPANDVASQTAFIQNPVNLTFSFGDFRMFRLTSDPELDGIPAVKKMFGFSSSAIMANQLYHLGLGLFMPGIGNNGAGGLFGGGQRIVWSGDSGTQKYIKTDDGWFMTSAVGSGPPSNIMSTLNLVSETTDYEEIAPSTKKYYVMEQLQDYTPSINQQNNSTFYDFKLQSKLFADNEFGSSSKLSNIITMKKKFGDAPSFNPNISPELEIGTFFGSGLTLYINPEGNSTVFSPLQNNMYSANQPSSSQVSYIMNDGNVLGDGSNLQNTDVFIPYAGETGSLVWEVTNPWGMDSVSSIIDIVALDPLVYTYGYDPLTKVFSGTVSGGTDFDLSIPPQISIFYSFSSGATASTVTEETFNLEIDMSDFDTLYGVTLGESFIAYGSVTSRVNGNQNISSTVYGEYTYGGLLPS